MLTKNADFDVKEIKHTRTSSIEELSKNVKALSNSKSFVDVTIDEKMEKSENL